jgi:hypothetical protein
MNRPLIIGGALTIVAAFVAGFWPEHRQLGEARDRIQSLNERLSDAEERVRLGQLLGQVLRLNDAVTERNFGIAAADATTYFDAVRGELANARRAEVKSALDQILKTRDAVTARLARTDPAVSETLRQQELLLRRTLGYPMGASKQAGGDGSS